MVGEGGDWYMGNGHHNGQRCARLYQRTVPVQPTSRAQREFSEFFTASGLGACTHNLLITRLPRLLSLALFSIPNLES
eukprot:scaffold66246_cov23-Cyclotella_meneghiniana.AAC.1